MNAVVKVDALEGAFNKALGLDRVPPEQRELAIAIAKRYDLDLMLKHLILVEGRPYITRDGLLHVAHRSGVFDGIEVSEPTLRDGYWHTTVTVYRKDMTRGFTYHGRYPEKGRNAAFGPEMSTKVGEVMALRRAFDVSAPVAEERWDLDEPTTAPEPRPVASLAEKAASRRAAIEARAIDEPVAVQATGEGPASVPPASPPTSEPDVPPAVAVGGGEAAAIAPASPAALDPDVRPCGRPDPVGDEACVLEMGHTGKHAGKVGTWK